MSEAPLRLQLDSRALVANYRWLAKQGGAAACGAAVKANGYGLGAQQVVNYLAAAGCRDFFVATWDEARALRDMLPAGGLSVLHGVREEDMAAAVTSRARPTLNTPAQVVRWQPTGLPCDVMIDTGMNRLGLSVQNVVDGLLTGLNIDTLMSHLACADEDVSANARQKTDFAGLAGLTSAKRLSLANSAGICLGPDYAFNLTRPGLALYGGVPRSEAQPHIAQVVTPQAQIIQRRLVPSGGTIGYNCTFTASVPTEVAILNIGYADGYLRCFSNMRGSAGDGSFPVLGRVSMDLIAINVDDEPSLGEGAWVNIDYDLPKTATVSGLSQYELLTGLGSRFDRIWHA